MNENRRYREQRFSIWWALGAAICAFVIYLLTSDSSVSYWDCPEYVLTASSLQIGHPPGNPIWTLAMRMATIPFPPEMHARVINLCSGVLMALAVFFLARICYYFIIFIGTHPEADDEPRSTGRIATIASSAAALCFAVLDSTWFSAVEAEVYAFSTFLTTFTLWLMIRFVRSDSPNHRQRLLILIAYVLGLSLGVHQLNLLVLPVLALIYIYSKRGKKRCVWQGWAAIFISFIGVGLILLGLMPGAISWAALLELFFVNRLGLPYFSGVIFYPVIVLCVAILAAWLIPRVRIHWVIILLFSLLWVSGIFVFKGNLFVALLISIVAATLLGAVLSRRQLLTGAWMLTMVWIGYSAVALILIRGYASPPVNEGAPADIFSLQRYLSREQYGSKPLFYGATPFSRPVVEERFKPGNPIPDYSRYALRKGNPRYAIVMDQPFLMSRSRFLSAADSAQNNKITERQHGYLLSDYNFSRINSPELDMWFPRITSGAPNMLESYADWAGMTPENMHETEISTAIDSAGNFVGKLSFDGERLHDTGLRPTYLQNLRFFLSYQSYYMYLRYLLWNFIGRQNDIPSTGEVDHGNVLTGITPIDNLMVGDMNLVPSSAGKANPGRHIYYGLPFLIGILGIIYLLRTGRKGRQCCAVVTLLFLMTGLAIVVYLNQNPGEPRERDYAFIGSYMAYCIWMAFGLVYIYRISAWLFNKLNTKHWKITSSGLAATVTMSIVGAGTFCLLFVENLPDHNRSGRFHTRAFALNILAGKERDIIISYGDNFSFPLWYAQEVENAAPGATIVDASYLATPEYVINLLKQENKGIELTARASDIAYGAYSHTRIAPDADTVPIPLIDLLRELYSAKEGAPVIRHSKALLPGLTLSDTTVLNLRQLATVSGMIPFRTLMLLDIIATNLEKPDPRPLTLLTSVKKEITLPVDGRTRVDAFGDTYAPAMSREEYVKRLTISAEAVDSTWRVHSGKQPYTDPVCDDQIRRQRGGVIRAARQLAMAGEEQKAQEILLSYPDLYPSVAPGSYTVADTTFHVDLDAASLLLEIGTPEAIAQAQVILDRASDAPEEWMRYYLSLPTWRRSTVSNSSRILINSRKRIKALRHRLDSIKTNDQRLTTIDLTTKD